MTVEAESAHRGLVRHRIENRILRSGRMAVGDPIRHHKNIVGTPVEGLAADLGATLPLENAIDGAGHPTLWSRGFASAQKLAPERHGRHHRASRDRIDIFDDHTVIWAALVVPHAIQGPSRVGPTIDELGRVLGDAAIVVDEQGFYSARRIKIA